MGFKIFVKSKYFGTFFIHVCSPLDTTVFALLNSKTVSTERSKDVAVPPTQPDWHVIFAVRRKINLKPTTWIITLAKLKHFQSQMLGKKKESVLFR